MVGDALLRWELLAGVALAEEQDEDGMGSSSTSETGELRTGKGSGAGEEDRRIGWAEDRPTVTLPCAVDESMNGGVGLVQEWGLRKDWMRTRERPFLPYRSSRSVD
jgi:hypothetical protein